MKTLAKLGTIIALIALIIAACGSPQESTEAPVPVPTEIPAPTEMPAPKEGYIEVGPIPMGNNGYADFKIGETPVQANSDINFMVLIYYNEKLEATRAQIVIDYVLTADPEEWLRLSKQDNSIITVTVPQESPLLEGEFTLTTGQIITIPKVSLAIGDNTFTGGMFEVYGYENSNPVFEMSPQGNL